MTGLSQLCGCPNFNAAVRRAALLVCTPYPRKRFVGLSGHDRTCQIGVNGAAVSHHKQFRRIDAAPDVSSQSASCRFCSGDFFCAVSIGAEHPIVCRRTTKMGIDVFPHDLSASRDLKQASEVPLANQRIPVRQTLCIRNPGTEEIAFSAFSILPDDSFGCQLHFDDARKWHRMVQAVRPIVEDQQVAISQRCGSVLTASRGRAELPNNCASLSLDNDDRGYGPEAHDDVAIRQFGQAVSIRPGIARLLDRCGLHHGQRLSTPHKQAGHMTCTRPQAESQKNPLTRGRRPHMTQAV